MSSCNHYWYPQYLFIFIFMVISIYVRAQQTFTKESKRLHFTECSMDRFDIFSNFVGNKLFWPGNINYGFIFIFKSTNGQWRCEIWMLSIRCRMISFCGLFPAHFININDPRRVAYDYVWLWSAELIARFPSPSKVISRSLTQFSYSTALLCVHRINMCPFKWNE